MKYIQNAHSICTLKVWAAIVIAFGLVAGPGLWAQNAAQKAALAQLRPHTNARALDASASSSEAANTSLNQPAGLAFDGAGDIFIADSANNLIREVDLNGIITTVAGTGEQGFGGDGGAATSALLDTPMGIAVDSAGNLYIADTHNHRIREVSSGTITTIAGTGVAGFSGDGAAATTATLNQPVALAIDSRGYLYIADTRNHRIREIVSAISVLIERKRCHDDQDEHKNNSVEHRVADMSGRVPGISDTRKIHDFLFPIQLGLRLILGLFHHLLLVLGYNDCQVIVILRLVLVLRFSFKPHFWSR